MSTDQNKAVYRRFIQEAFNKGNLDVLDEVLAPNYVYRDAPPGTPAGAEGIRQVVTMFRNAFPDLTITIEDQVAESDLVASRTVMRGTQRGPIFGIPASGNRVAVPGLTMVRVVEGKVAESWVKNDATVLMAQLEAGAPAPAAAGGRR
jgi:steroid delta-isomerase-like uncharacterized protein